MASRLFFEDDLSCPVCYYVFLNPVVLSCSHSICEDCLQRFWENRRIKECPVCRRRSSREHPPLNLALRNLCETYLQKPSETAPPNVCSVHNEKLNLYCFDDQQPVCLVCRDSRNHAFHSFCPINEVVMDKKEILKDALERLKEKQRIFENSKLFYNEDDQQIKFNAEDAERQIKKEFEELHQFLRNEEAARIKALREEEKQRSQTIKQRIEEMSKHISSLSCTIRDIEEQMKAEDVSFLQNINATLQRAQCNPPVSEPYAAVMIGFLNHLTNLKFTVLQKMQENFGQNNLVNPRNGGNRAGGQMPTVIESRSSSNNHPLVNLALRNLCETFLQEKRQKSSSGICTAHNEKLKLFCLDDQEPVCLVCRDSRKHTHHRFCPIDEAVIDSKEKLKAELKLLQEKLRAFQSVKQLIDGVVETDKADAQYTERQIKEVFEELHQFLRDEEAARITALREEEKQRNQQLMEKFDNTSRQISSLTLMIRDIEKQMNTEDVSFLQNVKSTLQRAQQRQPDPEGISFTVSFTNHLFNLKSIVVQRMQDSLYKNLFDPLSRTAISENSVKSNDKFVQKRTGYSLDRVKLQPHRKNPYMERWNTLPPRTLNGKRYFLI